MPKFSSALTISLSIEPRGTHIFMGHKPIVVSVPAAKLSQLLFSEKSAPTLLFFPHFSFSHSHKFMYKVWTHELVIDTKTNCMMILVVIACSILARLTKHEAMFIQNNIKKREEKEVMKEKIHRVEICFSFIKKKEQFYRIGSGLSCKRAKATTTQTEET